MSEDIKLNDTSASEDASEIPATAKTGLITAAVTHHVATSHPDTSSSSLLKSNYFIAWIRRNRCMLLLTLAVIFAMVAILVSRPISNSVENISDSFLEKTSEFYAKNLDLEIDPCQNFYQFVCNKTSSRFKARNLTDFNMWDQMSEDVSSSLIDLLSLPPSDLDSKLLSGFKAFYKTCTSEDHKLSEEIFGLRRLLEKIGGWPFLDEQENILRSDDQSWEEIIGQLNRAGFVSFFPFNVNVDVDPRNDTKLSLVFLPYQPQGEYVFSTNPTADYIQSVLSLLLDKPKNNNTIDIGDLLDFEKNLNEIADSEEEDYMFYLVGGLPIYFPEIDWTLLLDQIFIESPLTLSENDVIIFSHPGYLSRVASLLKKTTTSTIRNYFAFKILDAAISILPFESKFRMVKREFYEDTTEDPRNIECLGVLMAKVAVPMRQLYVDHFLQPEAKHHAEQIYKAVKDETHAYLQKVDWIEGEVKQQVLNNLKRLNMTFGSFEGSTNIESFLGNLTFSLNGTNLSHHLELAKLQRRLVISMFTISRQEYENMFFFVETTKTNAMCIKNADTCFMPAALMQKPMFDLNQPNYLNYGGAGSIIGHEMTHALRILSACPDATSCSSFDKFEKQKICLTNVYSDFLIEGIDLTVDGNRTLEENLGDYIGLRMAYRAYVKWAKENNDSAPKLEGVKLSDKQLFWVNAATFHCSYQDPGTLKYYFKNGEHSPPEARVNVILSIMDEFVQDFGCKVGDSMNPVRKCRVLLDV